MKLAADSKWGAEAFKAWEMMPWDQKSKIKVIVDGRVYKDCVYADEEAGYIVVFARDLNGRLVVVNDRALQETVKGKVEIRLS